MRWLRLSIITVWVGLLAWPFAVKSLSKGDRQERIDYYSGRFFEIKLASRKENYENAYAPAKVAQVKTDFHFLETAFYLFFINHDLLLPVPNWIIEDATKTNFRKLATGVGDQFLRYFEQPVINIEEVVENLREENVLDLSAALRYVCTAPEWELLEGGHRHPRTLDPFTGYTQTYGYTANLPQGGVLLLRSVGPDGDEDLDLTKFNGVEPDFGMGRPIEEFLYDPTNGVVSDGDIFWINPYA